MTDKKTFGSFVKTKRTEKGYSQKDLAEILFVTEGAVSKWERGVSYPDITLISELCKALDISEHELITASTDLEARKTKQDARKFRVIRSAWFWVPTLSYAVAIAVCFICNLAINRTLSWFFIVLAALLCAFSFVPTFTSFVRSNKLLVFAATSYGSICLLLFSCAVYTGGLSWFLTASLGVLMGYVMLFGPVLLSETRYSRYKFVLSFGMMFVLTILMLLHIRIWKTFPLGRGILMTAYGYAPVLVCACICTLGFDGFLKAGFCTAVGSVMLYFANYVASALFGPGGDFYRVDFCNWEQCRNGNMNLLALLSLVFVGTIFVGIGIFRVRRKNKH